jgi:hypothetical protein
LSIYGNASRKRRAHAVFVAKLTNAASRARIAFQGLAIRVYEADARHRTTSENPRSELLIVLIIKTYFT